MSIDHEQPVIVRVATSDDADALLALQLRLDAQSSFMMLEPGERDPDPSPLRRRLASSDGGFDLVAPTPDAPGLVGWLSVDVLPYRRARHVGYVVLGVDARAAGRGIGRGLLDAAATRAAEIGLHRLELTVMCDNDRALRLYQRAGYEIEGTRRHSIRRGGTFVDEYAMARLLTPPESRSRTTPG